MAAHLALLTRTEARSSAPKRAFHLEHTASPRSDVAVLLTRGAGHNQLNRPRSQAASASSRLSATPPVGPCETPPGALSPSPQLPAGAPQEETGQAGLRFIVVFVLITRLGRWDAVRAAPVSRAGPLLLPHRYGGRAAAEGRLILGRSPRVRSGGAAEIARWGSKGLDCRLCRERDIVPC